MKSLSQTRKIAALTFAVLAAAVTFFSPTFARVRDHGRTHNYGHVLVDHAPAKSSVEKELPYDLPLYPTPGNY